MSDTDDNGVFVAPVPGAKSNTASRVRAHRIDQRLEAAREKRLAALKAKEKTSPSPLDLVDRKASKAKDMSGQPTLPDVLARVSGGAFQRENEDVRAMFFRSNASGLTRPDVAKADTAADAERAFSRPVPAVDANAKILPEPTLTEPIVGAAASLEAAVRPAETRIPIPSLILGFAIGACLAIGLYLLFEKVAPTSQALVKQSTASDVPAAPISAPVDLTGQPQTQRLGDAVFLKPPTITTSVLPELSPEIWNEVPSLRAPDPSAFAGLQITSDGGADDGSKSAITGMKTGLIDAQDK